MVNAVPYVASQTLHTLRNLYFIVTRLGHNSFSQFTFVYTASIDLLSKWPAETEKFLRDIRPSQSGSIPEHPIERTHDLFFLNTAEHFTLEMPPLVCDELMIPAAAPYLGTGNDSRLLEIFEAAHSVMLAIFSAPHNFDLTTRHLPFYIDTLFQVYTLSYSPHRNYSWMNKGFPSEPISSTVSASVEDFGSDNVSPE